MNLIEGVWMLFERNLELADPRDKKTYFLKNTTTRQILTPLVYRLFLLLSDIHVNGLENLPPTGGVILASNHLTNFDVFPMQFALPRLIFFMGKAELFNNPLLDPILRRMGGFPVHRGHRDEWALRHAASVLENGQVLGIFPEGKRSKGQGLHSAKTGAARLAIEAGCPVVPMGIKGTEGLFNEFPWRGAVHIRIGEPLIPDPYESPIALTDRIMYAIANLLPLNLRGVYAEKARGFE
jgi:1-acyl-sn-glycerol-3-phosphate acyltransferase